MTAQHYYEKYKGYFFFENIVFTPSPVAINLLVAEFNKEAHNLCSGIGIDNAIAVLDIYNAQRRKWDELCDIFVSHHGCSPIHHGEYAGGPIVKRT
jgi:hypothetical protein